MTQIMHGNSAGHPLDPDPSRALPLADDQLEMLSPEDLRRRYRELAAQYDALNGAHQAQAAANHHRSALVSDAHMRLALDAANAGAWEWNLATNENIWSDELWRLYGLDRGTNEPSYEAWLRSVHPDDRTLMQTALTTAVGSGNDIALEWRVNAPSDPKRWLMSRGQPVRDAAGHVTAYRGVVIDITNRILAEQALRENQAKLEAALSSMTDAVFISDITGHFVHFNDAFVSFHRFNSKSECAQNLSDYPNILEVYLPTNELAPLDMWAVPRALRGETATNAEYTLRRKDTGESWIGSYSFSPIRDQHGAIVGSVVVGRDITDLKNAELEREKLEAKLRQSHKMDAVGQLAGGIAHDFNNLLLIIHGFTVRVQEGLDNTSESFEELEEVRKAAERATELTRQLLTFSRRQIIQPVDLDLNNLIESALKMIRRLIGENVELQFFPSATLGAIHADKGQMEQVLINLCLNARDAMPNGGTLIIETDNVMLTDAYCREHPDIAEGPAIRMAVTDTGHGMDEITRAQVFEPFFTTKGVGQGTGLGLATVYGIVKQHHGAIQLQTELGAGTTFEIYFPRVAQAGAAVDSAPGIPVAGGAEGILIAEDEEGVRNLLCRQLTAAGYTVYPARNGLDALRVFDDHADTIALAILDVMMPKLGGRDVMNHIQAKAPRTRFLFCSGYSQSAIHTDFVIEHGLRLIPKPYDRDELLRAIRETLDARHEP